MRKCFFALLFILSLNVQALDDYERQQIQKRIAPVGQVTVKEEQDKLKKETPEPVKKVVKKQEAGQKIYEQYCATCHRGGLAGAPKFRNVEEWKPKLASKNIDELTASAVKGINAMPAKGTCMDCSEADIKAAIKYMLPKS